MTPLQTAAGPAPQKLQSSVWNRASVLLARIAGSVNGHGTLAFALLSLIYFFVVYFLSSLKLLWLDELITLHIARLGSIGAIWQALAAGADPNPPLIHILVHLCRKIFGEWEFGLRLPAVIGYWVGMASLFAFLRGRVPAIWALTGTILSMSMVGFGYSYESRSYGLFYGLAMLAFLCWSKTTNSHSSATTQRLALAGMVLALAGGICTHYFAVLTLIPLAAGELTRTIVRSGSSSSAISDERIGRFDLRALWDQVDLRVWVGLALAATPLLAFRGLIAKSISKFAPYAWNRVSTDEMCDSYTQMVDVVLYWILALLMFAIVILALARICGTGPANLKPLWIKSLVRRQASTRTAVLPLHEAVAVFFLMAYPILGFVMATIHGGMLSPRFVIPVCFGFAIAGSTAAYRLFGQWRWTGTVALLAVTSWFIVRELGTADAYRQQQRSFRHVLEGLREAERHGAPGEPIVIPDPLMVLTFEHYAPPSMAARVVLPVDFPAIRLYRREDSPEENIWGGRGSIYPLRVITVAELQQTSGPYVILATDDNWLIEDLLRHRYPVERLPIDTHAVGIDAPTPLLHGPPVFYLSAGDKFFAAHPAWRFEPLPFSSAKNLPESNFTPAEGGRFTGPDF